MTNLHLALFSAGLTLVILSCLWLAHRSIAAKINFAIGSIFQHVMGTERSLRSHIVDEVDGLQRHTVDLAANTLGQLHRTETVLRDFVKDHFSDLRKHAEDLRNHAKELSDRAEVSASAPRQAVTRN